jgi:uncharacterized membrane protein YecN with MAPEG domain
MVVTAMYAGVLTLLFVALSMRVIDGRRGSGMSLGDGGDPGLQRRMRVQANFAEYVPLALILMGLAESLHVNAWILHALGTMLLMGRILHAFGMSRTNEAVGLRVGGTVLTFAVLLTGGAACFVFALNGPA